MPRIIARHYETARPLEVIVDGSTIVAVHDVDPGTYNLDELPWITPGFCDPQINGAVGISFLHPSRLLTQEGPMSIDPQEAWERVINTCRSHGIGIFLPTLITASFETTRQALLTWERVCAMHPHYRQVCPGYHLEGPYLSPEDGPRGAHPREYIRNPDWDEFQRWQEAANGHIRMVTLAPERPGAIPMIEKLVVTGVVVAIGHTAATADAIHAAVQAGARLSTHLGNGCHAVLPRHDNYLWEQLACDELWASIICDGFHLPPAVVKCLVRAKTLERLLLTCDASSLAGLPAGRYQEWNTDIEISPAGRISVAGTPFLAGSGLFTDTCVSNVIRFAGLTLSEAIRLATLQPRRLLGLPLPELAPGMPADWLTFRWDRQGAIHDIHWLNEY
jgi:N-acetylglucosamine-6-phosphate deacetylase